MEPGTLTAGTLRKMIANVPDNEIILFMKEDNGIGYNATSVEFTPIDKEDDWPATLWIID